MSDADRRLAQLFAADMPLATDRTFTIAVLERIERRRMWLTMFETAPFFVAAAALLWLLAPALDSLVQSSLALIGAPSFLATASLLLTVYVVLAARRGRVAWSL